LLHLPKTAECSSCLQLSVIERDSNSCHQIFVIVPLRFERKSIGVIVPAKGKAETQTSFHWYFQFFQNGLPDYG